MLVTGTATLSTVRATAPPTLIGSAGARQTRVVVTNRGSVRVWLGSRDVLAPPTYGIVLNVLEQYVHDGPDPLYAALDPALAPLSPALIATLNFLQYTADPPGAASITGPAFPWPTPADQ